MTVTEFIIELEKLDQDTEVWVDTDLGLMPVNGICCTSDTTIITYTDEIDEDTILN